MKKVKVLLMLVGLVVVSAMLVMVGRKSESRAAKFQSMCREFQTC